MAKGRKQQKLSNKGRERAVDERKQAAESEGSNRAHQRVAEDSREPAVEVDRERGIKSK
jgi:hypothetical protein